MEQMTMDAFGEDVTPPSWPKCFKLCANFSNLNEDGSRDYFMNWGEGKPDLSKPRCVVGIRNGISNCTKYIPKED